MSPKPCTLPPHVAESVSHVDLSLVYHEHEVSFFTSMVSLSPCRACSLMRLRKALRQAGFFTARRHLETTDTHPGLESAMESGVSD